MNGNVCFGSRFFFHRGAEGFSPWVGDLGYDGVAFGRTDMLDAPPPSNATGAEGFARFAGALPRGTAVVASNVVATAGGALDGVVEPFAVIRLGGVKVGVVSLVGADAAAPAVRSGHLAVVTSPGAGEPGACADDAVYGARFAVHALRAAHPDVDSVVALSSLTPEEDARVARAAGVDVVVGRYARGATTATAVADDVTNRTVVVARLPEPYGTALGRAMLTLNAGTGAIEAHEVSFVPVDPAASVSSGSAQLRSRLEADLQAEWDTLDDADNAALTVSAGPVEHSGERCALADCASGRLMAAALLGGCAGCDAALVGADAVAAGLPGGNVSRGDVARMLPGHDTVVVANVTGATLLEMLERSVANYSESGPNPLFVQLAGLRAAWRPDVAAAGGGGASPFVRVSLVANESASFDAGDDNDDEDDNDHKDENDIDEDDFYCIVLTARLLDGLGSYPGTSGVGIDGDGSGGGGWRSVHDTGVTLVDAVAGYLASAPVLPFAAPSADGCNETVPPTGDDAAEARNASDRCRHVLVRDDDNATVPLTEAWAYQRQVPAVAKLGVLLPPALCEQAGVGGPGWAGAAWLRELAAIVAAVNAVNANPSVLPTTVVEIEYPTAREVASNASAEAVARRMLRDTGVMGLVVGPGRGREAPDAGANAGANDDVAYLVAALGAAFEAPVFAPAVKSDPLLSVGAPRELFRTCPGDDQLAVQAARLCEHFAWDSVVLVRAGHGVALPAGRAMESAFRSAAAAGGVVDNVNTTVVPEGESELEAVVGAIASGHVRIVVLLGLSASDGRRFVEAADAAGVADEGWAHVVVHNPAAHGDWRWVAAGSLVLHAPRLSEMDALAVGYANQFPVDMGDVVALCGGGNNGGGGRRLRRQGGGGAATVAVNQSQSYSELAAADSALALALALQRVIERREPVSGGAVTDALKSDPGVGAGLGGQLAFGSGGERLVSYPVRNVRDAGTDGVVVGAADASASSAGDGVDVDQSRIVWPGGAVAAPMSTNGTAAESSASGDNVVDRTVPYVLGGLGFLAGCTALVIILYSRRRNRDSALKPDEWETILKEKLGFEGTADPNALADLLKSDRLLTHTPSRTTPLSPEHSRSGGSKVAAAAVARPSSSQQQLHRATPEYESYPPAHGRASTGNGNGNSNSNNNGSGNVAGGEDRPAVGVIPTELKRGAIQLLDELGRGNFGTVHKAQYRPADGKPRMLAAAKTLNDAEDQAGRTELLEEAAIMAQFSHPNLVSLIGVVTRGFPPVLLMEYCEHGTLQNFLRAQQMFTELTANAKLKIMLDVALGMQALHRKRVLHRDLSARNVIIDSSFVCKVSDFGLSRNCPDVGRASAAEGIYYRARREGPLPVRWTAPEALTDALFTTKSDVFSYGVTVYEIYTHGATPYRGMTNGDVFRTVVNGGRLDCPTSCPDEVYDAFIDRCWAPELCDRPTFDAVVADLDPLVVHSGIVGKERLAIRRRSLRRGPGAPPRSGAGAVGAAGGGGGGGAAGGDAAGGGGGAADAVRPGAAVVRHVRGSTLIAPHPDVYALFASTDTGSSSSSAGAGGSAKSTPGSSSSHRYDVFSPDAPAGAFASHARQASAVDLGYGRVGVMGGVRGCGVGAAAAGAGAVAGAGAPNGVHYGARGRSPGGGVDLVVPPVAQNGGGGGDGGAAAAVEHGNARARNVRVPSDSGNGDGDDDDGLPVTPSSADVHFHSSLYCSPGCSVSPRKGGGGQAAADAPPAIVFETDGMTRSAAAMPASTASAAGGVRVEHGAGAGSLPQKLTLHPGPAGEWVPPPHTGGSSWTRVSTV